MDKRHKVLISSDFGIGKSWLALSYAAYLPEGEDMISLDYEDGQEYYVAPSRDQVDPSRGIFYVRRLLAPTVYEVKAIVAKIADPERPGRELLVDRKPLEADRLSKEVKQVMGDIQMGKLHPTAIAIDTVTRLCELTTARIFGDLIERRGEDFAERMSQLTWAKVKDDLSELFYQIITEARLSLIMTAWAKTRYDKQARRSTDELIADVLKNVRAFVSLELMLEASPVKGVRVPRATVVKSRLVELPKGATLEKATWESIFAAEPKFVEEEPAEAQAAPSE